MDSINQFEQFRPLLFSIAYRMLANVDDAEDIVQETCLRWMESSDRVIESPKAYFTKIITRLCIDRLRSAKVQRESYIGPWLPEPLAPAEKSPAALAETADSISLAFLTVLEVLNPKERAVYLLKQVFDYPHQEIGPIVGTSEENCRQLFRRAKKQLVDKRPRFRAGAKQHEAILSAFSEAYREGNLNSLVSILSKDCILITDSGGKAEAAPAPIYKAENIADFLVQISGIAFQDTYTELLKINGQLSLVFYKDNFPQTLICIEANSQTIEKLLIIRNPDKLKSLTKK